MRSWRPSRWRTAALLALLACAPALALPPDKAFTHAVVDRWSIQDGLPQISAHTLAQDRTGYVWVGTQSGLARFDGVRFVTYTPKEAPALPGIWVRTLLAGRDGRLWIGTYKGLAVHADGEFRPVPAQAAARYPALDIFTLAETADGRILAGTSEGVFTVVRERLVAVSGPNPALALLPENGTLWIGTTGAVVRRSAGGEMRLPLPTGAETAAVTRLVRAHGRLWAATSQGLMWLGQDGWQRVAELPLGRTPITALFLDRGDNLWVGSNPGLGRWRDGRQVEFVADSHPRAFPQVIALMEDREGSLWLGSQIHGMARVWSGWTRRYSVGEGLHDAVVWSLSRGPDGRLWVGTNSGVSLLENGRYTLQVPGDALPHPHAYNLLAESDRLWIGTRRGLVVWRDGRLSTPPELRPMAAAQINGIVPVQDGSVWFPTTEGLFHLRDGRLTRYAQEAGLPDPRVRVIAFHRGRLLLGTQSGLFELRDGHAVEVGREQGLPPGLDISALQPLRDGRLVLGSLDEQLWVEAGGHWHALGPAQGMPSNAPFFIAEHDGWLWVAGIRGIARVPLADLPRSAAPVRRVRGEMLLNERGDPNAGQQGYCCNGAGMSKGFLREGVLWLPSRDGVVAMDTMEIRKNPLPPPLLVEAVVAGGERLVPAGRPLQLPAGARDLAFEFTALSFQDPRSLQLQYRLDGYDRDWQPLPDARRRSVNYTNLPPGDYVFEVRGANNAGVWNPAPAQAAFRIQPYFHETALFRLLLAGVAATLLYAAWRRQQLRHARQAALLEAEVRARTQELHAANERLENASQTDPLTGLRNRRYLANQIPADFAYYEREQRRSGNYEQVMVFALVDIDRFKAVNDMYGHGAGDRVLQQAGQVLSSLVRGGDYIARWGGEEFLLVFRPMPSRHALILGERLCSAFAAHPFDIGGNQPLWLTCSVGLSEYPLFRDPGQHVGWEQMVALADAALYWVKQHGRNGWAAFRPTPQADVARLVRELHQNAAQLLAEGRVRLVGSPHVLPPQATETTEATP